MASDSDEFEDPIREGSIEDEPEAEEMFQLRMYHDEETIADPFLSDVSEMVPKSAPEVQNTSKPNTSPEATLPRNGLLANANMWACKNGPSDQVVAGVAYQGLNRPKFPLWDKATTAPPESREMKSWKKYFEKGGNVYMEWPLYTQFHRIETRSKSTWPPPNVLLQDWHIGEVLKAKLGVKACHTNWRGDFDCDGHVFEFRTPRGAACKVLGEDGKWHYAVT